MDCKISVRWSNKKCLYCQGFQPPWNHFWFTFWYIMLYTKERAQLPLLQSWLALSSSSAPHAPLSHPHTANVFCPALIEGPLAAKQTNCVCMYVLLGFLFKTNCIQSQQSFFTSTVLAHSKPERWKPWQIKYVKNLPPKLLLLLKLIALTAW